MVSIYMIQLQDHRFIHPSQHPVLLDKVNIFAFVTFITPTKFFDQIFFYFIAICITIAFTKKIVMNYSSAFKMLGIESKSMDTIVNKFRNTTTDGMFISTIHRQIWPGPVIL